MNILKKILSFFFLIILFSESTTFAGFSCGKIFNSIQKIPIENIRFSQNFLGHAWANYQLKKFEIDYEQWLKSNSQGKPEQYILEQTKNRPFPVFRDTHGELRQFDRHHQYKIYQTFMGGKNFSVYVRFFFDYTKPNPRTSKPWKKKEMMTHAANNGFVSFFGIENPRFKDLKNLPRNIEDIPDLPIRSLISFIFRNSPFPLKGNDFQSMIQFKLAEFMITEGINIYPRKPFHRSNVDKLTQKFFENPKILRFLLDRINPNILRERRKRISSFLKKTLDTS